MRLPAAALATFLGAAASVVAGCGHKTRSNPLDPDAATGSKPTATPYVGTFSWQPGGRLPVALWAHRALVHQGYVYVLGGADAAFAPRSEVWSAPILAGGQVGPFAATSPMPTPAAAHALAVEGTWAYVTGGYVSAGVISSAAWSARLGAAGSVRSWPGLATLPRYLAAHGAALTAGRIFVAGGNAAGVSPTPGGVQDRAYSAQRIGASVGAFVPAAALPTAVHSHGLLSGPDWLLSVGGYGDGGTTSAAWRTSAAADGTLSGWIPTEALPEPLQASATTLHGPRVLVAGGSYGVTPSSSTYLAAVAAGGVLSPWTQLSDLPYPLAAAAAVSDGSYVFVLGGVSAAGVPTDLIWSGEIP